ncbi:sensor domain-containing protein [Streptomyces sp. NPDC059002]|uniref:sensor domain-containing protein n=1 Tax=Streptomyces sp. NPDC059002 TaxID=3346690 RepID=UPI00368C6054
MSTSTLPYSASAAAPLQAPGPAAQREHVGFWRAPFAAATFREVGHVLVSLPVAIVGFTFAVASVSLGAGLLVTLLGLPVIAVALAAARGLGAAERRRARTGLGLDVAGPGPLDVPQGAGMWAGVRARLADAAGWRALLFQLVMFPWRVLSFTLSVTFLVTGWVVALFPTYSWVFHRYVGWPGYRLYDFTSGGERHQYYITSPAQVIAVGLVGTAIVFLTPKLVRALTNVERAAVRSLLG